MNSAAAVAFLRPRMADWHRVAGLSLDATENGFGVAIADTETHMGTDRFADDENDAEARAIMLAAAFNRVLDRTATMISYSVDQPSIRVEQGEFYKRCLERAKPAFAAAAKYRWGPSTTGFSQINLADLDATNRRREDARLRSTGQWSELG